MRKGEKMNNRPILTRRSLLRRTAMASIAVMGAAVLPIAVSTSARSGPGQYICQSDNVRLRSSYGLSASTIGTLNTGDAVDFAGETVDADGYTWMSVIVTATGTRGWIAMEFFEPVLGVIIWPAGTAVHVNSDNVNLRSGPGVGHSIVGTYNTGTRATIAQGPEQATGYYWYQINIGTITGWMAADFLTDGTGSGSDGGDTSWAVGTNVAPTTDLNLRSGPGTGNAVLGVYEPGEAATILAGPQRANGYSWYQVEVWSDANVGWFAGQHLELARFEPTGARHRVIDGPLNFRNGPSLDAAVISALSTGTVVVIADASFVQADGYTWMHVTLEDRPQYVGWIAGGFTEEI
jgi:uncharacterized protein YgiM (DUF1202 family)